MIEIVPAIDIIGGRCVRLTKGDYASQKTYDQDPAEMARAFAGCGVRRIHLVDLEGAKAGRPMNLQTLESIADALDKDSVVLEWGGGLGDEGCLQSAFSAGAGNLVIGSAAALRPADFRRWLMKFGPDRMVLGADVRPAPGQSAAKAKVAVKGWLEDAPVTIGDLLEDFDTVNQCIVTNIHKDGMLQGPDTPLYVELQNLFPGVVFTVSGGISGMADIEALDAAGLQKVIAGKAIYEGRISLKDIETVMSQC